jgi:hypothetical protein
MIQRGYFTFTNGTAGSNTTTSQNTCRCYYGTVSVPTTADTIAESMRPLLLPLERLRLLESMIMMCPTVATIAASATEGSPAVFEFSFKLLLWIQRIPLHSPMEPGLHYHFANSNVPAGATTGTVSVPTTADTIAESNETFTIASGTASATGTINDNDNVQL